jgi:hypothetical protein
MAQSGPVWRSIPQGTSNYQTTTPTTPSPSAESSSYPCPISLASTARSAYADWLTTLAPWELYLTLTYDPKRPEVNYARPSSWASRRHLARFYLQATEATGRPTFLAASLEDTRAGWPHWHGLLACGALSAREFALLSERWYSARGYAWFQRIQPGTVAQVAAYCAKYLTKAGSEVELLGQWHNRTAVLQATLPRRIR